MLFGWGDYRAHQGGKWANHRGLYRYNGGYGSSNPIAPLEMDYGVRNMTMELRYRVKTFCWGSDGATCPGDMGNAWGYLVGRDHSPILTTYNSAGLYDGNVTRAAANVIMYQEMPVIIGTGFFGHYQRRRFHP